VGRDTALVALIAVALFACGSSAPAGGASPSPPQEAPAAAAPRTGGSFPDLRSDVVSGCTKGSALVKILILLHPTATGCGAEVTPASVCVAPGGVVRFRVVSTCRVLEGDEQNPALRITEPSRKKLPHLSMEAEKAVPSLLETCRLKFARIDPRVPEVVHCDVNEKASHGFYKYGLQGKIDPLDPDIEVRGGDY